MAWLEGRQDSFDSVCEFGRQSTSHRGSSRWSIVRLNSPNTFTQIVREGERFDPEKSNYDRSSGYRWFGPLIRRIRCADLDFRSRVERSERKKWRRKEEQFSDHCCWFWLAKLWTSMLWVAFYGSHFILVFIIFVALLSYYCECISVTNLVCCCFFPLIIG